MALSDLTADAVNQAMAEFDQMGRPAFLKKYGFKRARNYVIRRDAKTYDSKAVAGAAHGYLSGRARRQSKRSSNRSASPS
jgi:5-methylcytosine-specific restriction enzyme A